MSLLLLESDKKIHDLIQKIFDTQLAKDNEINQEYDNFRKQKMKQDIKYNIETLNVAVNYEADLIFNDYADWIIKLLLARMKDLPEQRVKQQMISHYEILKQFVPELYSKNKTKIALNYLKQAVNITSQANLETIDKDHSNPQNQYEKIRIKYLNHLLQTDKFAAKKVIKQAVKSDIPIEDIYIEIFQKSLIKVGQLWHNNTLSVEEEHYITGMTQNIMMELWPTIFSQDRINKTIVACTVGQELHEMGIRMLCDILEIHGWDSIYLGAALPNQNIINSLKKYQPDLVALSVTMPHYLDKCHEIINLIQENNELKNIKIAVGGRAFQLAPHLLEKWGIDVFAENAKELVAWTKENL